MALATLVQPIPSVVGLDVSVSAEGASTVMAFRGEADVATVPVVVEALTRVLAEQESDVVVDLAQTEFIGVAALRAVLEAKDVLDHRGGRRLTVTMG